MAAETLNFGPEWLRALSSGGSITSPPPSPAMPKYKLAEYRYGREEMLALYVKDNKVPEEMQDKEFAVILQDEPLQPLALVPLTEEEQRNFSMSVNSVAVLRLMGKGGGPPAGGVARGRGSTRGRGRGRGESGFYQRSIEDGEGTFGRGSREIHRSQSWDDRGERRFEKPVRRDGARVAFDETGAAARKEFARSDSDNWRTLREEQEGDDEGSWRLMGVRRDGERWHSVNPDGKDSLHVAEDNFEPPSSSSPPPPPPPNLTWVSCPSHAASSLSPSPSPPLAAAGAVSECESDLPSVSKSEVAAGSEKELETAVEDLGAFSQPAQLSPGALSSLFSSPASTTTAAATEFSVGDNEDDDGMKHLQQEAEKLVASLQDSSLEEECFTQTMQEQCNTAAALPLSHEAAMKWFYKDPQGEIQGPFTTQEMAEWFHAGYFTMSLLVKRGCDEGFQPLGEVIKMWGRVPFAPGPSPPPLLGNMDQDRLKKQQELAAAALYQQLQHQQFLQLINSRQQYAQCALQQKAASGDLTPQQQQQLTMFLQQLQALKSRSGEQGMIPSMNRSMSVPDTGSLWDMHTSASQPTGSETSLWDLPINSTTQGPILEQLQLQHKLQERRDAELRAKREEEERKRREEKRRQEEQKRREEEELFRRKQCRQQQELLLKLLQHSQQQSSPPLWSNLSKQNLPMKALLELQQQENERHLQKQQRAQQRVHGGLSMGNSSVAGLTSQWSSDSNPLWANHEKSSSMSLWEESLKTSGSGVRSIGLKNSRSSPSLSESYGVPSRTSRKKTDEEEKLLKLLQGIGRPQDGFTQWCEQMLHALNTSNNLDVPTFVSFLKEVDSPYDVHDYIRSYLGDTLEAKEFAKQFLERRAKQKANQQRQQQQQEASWISPSSLQSMFQANHTSKQPLFDGSQVGKVKKRPVVLHADPSILGYSLHSTSGELETVEDY
uniref:GRB10-interacting GYF protein 1 isoform X10 n=1 Tax=Geotrypetes seraphini TaxID=260995 RepID=A0A6P8NV46_GEOSA|nr:GRB10-interacting GYF protein 1 isoform X10 [Geotrypetes seraphini]